MNNKRVVFLSIAAVFIAAAVLVTYSASATTGLREPVRGERAIQAETQRWEAMAAYYAKLAVPVTGVAWNRASAAESARWQGQADAYLAAVQRSQQAYAARWQGQAEAYQAAQLRAQQAYAARLQAMADYYLNTK